MCVAITAIAWSAAAQDAPMGLAALDDAVARGLRQQQHLALQRGGKGSSREAGRAAASMP